jgi:hypothetical protein
MRIPQDRRLDGVAQVVSCDQESLQEYLWEDAASKPLLHKQKPKKLQIPFDHFHGHAEVTPHS